VENEQLNTFGKQIKNALDNPDEYKKVDSNFGGNNANQFINGDGVNNVDSVKNEDANLSSKSKDNSMDAISHSIDVMIMKEAKMND